MFIHSSNVAGGDTEDETDFRTSHFAPTELLLHCTQYGNGMFGESLSREQLMRMSASAVGFELISRVSVLLHPRLRAMEAVKRRDVGVTLASAVHALVASACAVSIVTNPLEGTRNSLYAKDPRSQMLFGLSTGFFAWDLVVVTTDRNQYDPGFFVHALSCFLCYLFGQFPFLNHWGPYFLLFELSTPFLNARKMLVHLEFERNSKFFAWVENAFGLSFLLSRIIVGIPMSAMIWRDLLNLLRNHSHLVHNYAVVYFYLVANGMLCGLNLFWLYKMMRKRLGPGRGGRKKTILQNSSS